MKAPARLLALALLGVLGSSHGQQAPTWQVDLQRPVTLRGLPALDSTGGAAGGMLYPAPNLIGFFAAVLTHAALSSGAQAAQKQAAQAAADAAWSALQPVQAVLEPSGWWPAVLARPHAPAGSRLAVPDPTGRANGAVKVVPTLALSQDAELLLLDTGFALPAKTEAAPLEVLVRVVAPPVGPLPAREHWLSQDGATLRDTSADLMAHALAMVVRYGHAPMADDPPPRTWRYPVGKGLQSERAQLLGATCSRLLLRNLRGWLLSVPALPDDKPCAAEPYALPP